MQYSKKIFCLVKMCFDARFDIGLDEALFFIKQTRKERRKLTQNPILNVNNHSLGPVNQTL